MNKITPHDTRSEQYSFSIARVVRYRLGWGSDIGFLKLVGERRYVAVPFNATSLDPHNIFGIGLRELWRRSLVK